MIEELQIQNFRCFEDITISSIGQVNLIVGKNNIGKTSLLEAIYVYADGGSMFSIHKILQNRQESPAIPRINSRLINDSPSITERDVYFSIANIFNKNIKLDEQQCTIKIKDKDNVENAISIRNTENLEKEFQTLYEEGFSPINIRRLRSEMMKGFIFIQNKRYDYATPSSIIMNIEEPKLNTIKKIEICKSYNDNLTLFANLWSDLNDRNKSEAIDDTLKKVDSRILKAYYTPKMEVKVKLEGHKEAQMLSSLGDGVARIFQLFILAHSAEGGILTIDEFENGLHYSIQEDIFRELFRVTKELGVQVFITTHSADTIKAFSKIANEDNRVSARLIGLARSEKKSTKGRIFSITYEEHEMKSFIELDMEVRR